MPTINIIEASYRLYLSRLSKQSTRKDYNMRFNVFITWCSMGGVADVTEINFAQFLDYVFFDRCVSPRTHNTFCSQSGGVVVNNLPTPYGGSMSGVNIGFVEAVEWFKRW